MTKQTHYCCNTEIVHRFASTVHILTEMLDLLLFHGDAALGLNRARLCHLDITLQSCDLSFTLLNGLCQSFMFVLQSTVARVQVLQRVEVGLQLASSASKDTQLQRHGVPLKSNSQRWPPVARR